MDMKPVRLSHGTSYKRSYLYRNDILMNKNKMTSGNDLYYDSPSLFVAETPSPIRSIRSTTTHYPQNPPSFQSHRDHYFKYPPPQPPYYLAPPPPPPDYYSPYYYHYARVPIGADFPPRFPMTLKPRPHHVSSTNNRKITTMAMSDENAYNRISSTIPTINDKINKKTVDVTPERFRDGSSDSINTSINSAVVSPGISCPRTIHRKMNRNPTHKNQRPYLLPVLVSSSTSFSSTSSSLSQKKSEGCKRTTEILNTGEEDHVSASKKKRLLTDIPTNSVVKDDTIIDSFLVPFDNGTEQYTNLEIEQLTDALDMDRISFPCDDKKIDSGNGETPCFYSVNDPIDIELMATSRYIVFNNIGAGLDDIPVSTCIVSSPKKKEKQNKHSGNFYHNDIGEPELLPLEPLSKSVNEKCTITGRTQGTARSKSRKRKKNGIDTHISLKTSNLKSSAKKKGYSVACTTTKINKCINYTAPIRSDNLATAKTTFIANHNNKTECELNKSIGNNVSTDCPLLLLNYNTNNSGSESSIGHIDISVDIDDINTGYLPHPLDYETEESFSEINSSGSMDTGFVDIKADFPPLSIDCHVEDWIAATNDVALDSFMRSLIASDDDNKLTPSSYGF